MSHTLLNYYQQELEQIRELVNEFAQTHPNAAASLRLGAQGSEDAEIERLFQSYALLNAKICHRVDDEIPEISYPLLEKLMPHLLAPIPAMSIVQICFDRTKLMGCKTISAGTELKVITEQEEACYFSTRYPVDLWPIEITSAKLTGLPLQAPQIKNQQVKSTLEISLQCVFNTQTFSQLAPDKLRFFINADSEKTHALLTLLLGHTLRVALATHPADLSPVVLDASHIQSIGFSENENMLPYAKQVAHPCRLLTEFFIFPEKFLFFDVVGLSQHISKKVCDFQQTLQIYFYFDKSDKFLEEDLNKDHFLLNCTPIVNLFTKKIEPEPRQDSEFGYWVNSGPETEVHSLLQVVVNGNQLNETGYKLRYVPAWEVGYYDEHAKEIFLNFSELCVEKIEVNALCINKKLPSEHVNNFLLLAADDCIDKISGVTDMTLMLHPLANKNSSWEFIQQLSANILQSEDKLQSLRNLLELYDFYKHKEYRNLLDGILRVDVKRAAARQINGLWRGFEITIFVDYGKCKSLSVFLFGCALEGLFSLHHTNNFFTQLIIETPQQGILYKWPRRAGMKARV